MVFHPLLLKIIMAFGLTLILWAIWMALLGFFGLAQADGPRELTKRRTRHSQTFQMGEAQFQTTFGRDLHYQDASGHWQETDLTFRYEGTNPQPAPGVHILGPDDQYVMNRAYVVVTVKERSIEVVNPRTGKGIRWLLPGPARMEPAATRLTDRQKAAYLLGGAAWEYHNLPSGSKLIATVPVPQGQQTYSFPYELVGAAPTSSRAALDRVGAAAPLQLDQGRVTGDGFVLEPVVIIDALGNTYAAPYQLQSHAISFAFDDGVIPPGGFPYTIDPTTNFDVDANENDIEIEKQGTSYPPSGDSGLTRADGNSLRVTKDQTAGAVYINRTTVIAWDTSSLPDDALVTDASLTVNVTAGTNNNDRAWLVDWHSGVPPISVADYDEVGDGGAGEFADVAAIGSVTLDLNTDNHTVDLDGYTALRITVSGGAPPAAGNSNSWTFEAFNDPGTAEPRLSITYTDPLSQTTPNLGTIAPVTAYQGVRESGDLLVVAPYDIATGSGGLPSQLASNEYRFIFRDGTDYLQVVDPVSTSENALLGYREGFAAFYFTAAQVSNQGITFNSPGAYTVELDALDGAQNTTSTDINYRSGGVADLEADLSILAQTLEAEWDLDIINTGRLTATGQDYFETVIPFLPEMVPGFVNILSLRANPGLADHDTTASDNAADFWAGTTAETAFATLGNQWGLTSMQVRTAITLGLAFLVVAVALIKGAPAWGALMIAGLIVVMAAPIGMAPLALSLVIGFIGAFTGAFAWWISRG